MSLTLGPTIVLHAPVRHTCAVARVVLATEDLAILFRDVRALAHALAL